MDERGLGGLDAVSNDARLRYPRNEFNYPK